MRFGAIGKKMKPPPTSAWGRLRLRGHCRPEDPAQARNGLVGGFDAHITGCRLRQTISVFCSPGDQTRPAMQFFGHVAPESVTIGGGVAGLEDAAIDAAAQVFDESTEQSAVAGTDLVIRAKLDSDRAHGALPYEGVDRQQGTLELLCLNPSPLNRPL